MDLHLENYKSVTHLLAFVFVLLKVQLIDKKLSVLEKKVLDK